MKGVEDVKMRAWSLWAFLSEVMEVHLCRRDKVKERTSFIEMFIKAPNLQIFVYTAKN